MIKISKLADYACWVMREFARHPEATMSAAELSSAIHLAIPTVQKIVKHLQKAGLLRSTRGQSGGYQLARPVQMISILNIVEAMDGQIALTSCCHSELLCDKAFHCDIKPTWISVNALVQEALAKVGLENLVEKTYVNNN